MNTFLIVNFVIIIILLFLVLSLLIRVGRLERKAVDVTAKDVAAFVDQMREMVIESERAAERLDTTIRERETILEDLSDLVENRLTRLQQISPYENQSLSIEEHPLQGEIYRLILEGYNEAEIAKHLKISITEVNLVMGILHS